MQIIPFKLNGIFLLVGVLFSLFFFIFSQNFFFALALLFGFFITTLFLHNALWGLLLLIIIRQLTDRFNYIFNLGDFFSVNISGALSLLLLCFIAFYFLRFNFDKKLKTIPLFLTLGFFLLMASFSFFYSVDKTASIAEMIRIMAIFGLFFIFFDLFSKKPQTRSLFFHSIFLASFIPFSVAFYQLIFQAGLGGLLGVENRVFGTYAYPNAFAFFALVVFSLGVFYLYKEKAKKEKNQVIIFLGITFILLLSTFNRSVFISLLVFTAVLSIYKSLRLIFGIALLFLVIFFISPEVRYRVEETLRPSMDSSMYWRFKQWQKGLETFEKRPYGGYGIGTEAEAYRLNHGFDGITDTHNDYIQVLIELGIIGFILFLMYYLEIFIRVYRIYRNSSNKDQKNLALIFLALQISLIFYVFTSGVFGSTAIQWIYWPMLAATLAPWQKKQKDVAIKLDRK